VGLIGLISYFLIKDDCLKMNQCCLMWIGILCLVQAIFGLIPLFGSMALKWIYQYCVVDIPRKVEDQWEDFLGEDKCERLLAAQFDPDVHHERWKKRNPEKQSLKERYAEIMRKVEDMEAEQGCQASQKANQKGLCGKATAFAKHKRDMADDKIAELNAQMGKID